MSRITWAILPLILFVLSPPVWAEPDRSSALIVTGANNHDWEWTHLALRDFLMASDRFDVSITKEPGKTLADANALAGIDVFVLDYNGPRWGEGAEKNFLEKVRAGTGVVVIHAANNAFDGWVEYEKLVGLLWRKGTGHGRFHPFDVKVDDRNHPITRNLPDLTQHPDELYHKLVHMHDAKFRVLATALSSAESGGTGQKEPMITVANYGEGRVFHTPLGHVWKNNEASHASFEDPQFQDLVVRGTEWAATGNVTEPNTLTAAERLGGWQLLFDGESSEGWRGFKKDAFPEKGWHIADGAMQVLSKGGGGDVITENTYDNYELSLEFMVSPGANSGIIYGVSEEMGTTWQTGPEFQIFDDRDMASDGNTSVGSLYALYSPQRKITRPVGHYNRARLVVCGNTIEHWLNGVKVLEADRGSDDWAQRVAASKFSKMPKFGTVDKGHIALQDHGNDVWFRNIKIREIPEAERFRYTAAQKPLFNGRDFDGWSCFLNDGARLEDVWRIEDGVLICKGTPAGYIKTEADYTNFVLTLDWRWSPATKKAGNSGVLFRQIGADKVWPQCIEAQLMNGRAGDFWAIGNYPMKTSPARNRGRNTRHRFMNENPVGEWNHYEIIVDGGHVTLVVNGQILNTAHDCLVTPGKIALQSEGTEIHFRNIHLAPLPTRTRGSF